MPDFLDVLARDARETVAEGYYEAPEPVRSPPLSLRKAILESEIALIAEIKAASPSAGTIREVDPGVIARIMEKSGATGISVLTEPKHFNGSLSHLQQAREAVEIPILMKDIIIAPRQLDAAASIGANAVLLIQAVFDRGYSDTGLQDMIGYAHARGLEVLLETRSIDEFQKAVDSEADLIGINNRDLGTFQVDLGTTERILSHFESHGKVIVSESGIETPEDLQYLRRNGAHAFLVGTAIMASDDIGPKIRELVASP